MSVNLKDDTDVKSAYLDWRYSTCQLYYDLLNHQSGVITELIKNDTYKEDIIDLITKWALARLLKNYCRKCTLITGIEKINSDPFYVVDTDKIKILLAKQDIRK